MNESPSFPVRIAGIASGSDVPETFVCRVPKEDAFLATLVCPSCDEVHEVFGPAKDYAALIREAGKKHVCKSK